MKQRQQRFKCETSPRWRLIKREKRELNHLRRKTPRLTQQAAADLLATLHQQAVQVIDHAASCGLLLAFSIGGM